MTLRCDEPAESVPFAKLRAAATLPGWIERTDQYRSFTAKDFYSLVDGEAAIHEQLGLQCGIGITVASEAKLADIYIEDFGSPSHANAMSAMKKKSLSDLKNIPHVKVSPALYEEVIGGCIAFWVKGRCYVEMALTGYTSLDSATSDAATLIDSLAAVFTK